MKKVTIKSLPKAYNGGPNKKKILVKKDPPKDPPKDKPNVKPPFKLEDRLYTLESDPDWFNNQEAMLALLEPWGTHYGKDDLKDQLEVLNNYIYSKKWGYNPIQAHYKHIPKDKKITENAIENIIGNNLVQKQDLGDPDFNYQLIQMTDDDNVRTEYPVNQRDLRDYSASAMYSEPWQPKDFYSNMENPDYSNLKTNIQYRPEGYMVKAVNVNGKSYPVTHQSYKTDPYYGYGLVNIPNSSGEENAYYIDYRSGVPKLVKSVSKYDLDNPEFMYKILPTEGHQLNLITNPEVYSGGYGGDFAFGDRGGGDLMYTEPYQERGFYKNTEYPDYDNLHLTTRAKGNYAGSILIDGQEYGVEHPAEGPHKGYGLVEIPNKGLFRVDYTSGKPELRRAPAVFRNGGILPKADKGGPGDPKKKKSYFTYKPSLGLNLNNTNPYANVFSGYKSNPYANAFSEYKSKPFTTNSTNVAESTSGPTSQIKAQGDYLTNVINEAGGLDAYSKQVAAQRAYEALPNALRNPDVLTADKRSDLEKFARRAWTAVSHPMESMSAVNRGGYIPSGYLGMHNPYSDPNPMGAVVDMALGTPAFIANAFTRQSEKFADNPGEYLLTNTLGFFDPKTRDEALANYLDLAAFVPVAKAASPLLKSAGKSLITRAGEVKNIIRPPKISMNEASLYNTEKNEKLLKYLFDEELIPNTKEWDVKLWNKLAKNKISDIEKKYGVDKLRDRMNDALMQGDIDKYDAARKAFKLAEQQQSSEIFAVANDFYQKLANKLDYPINLQNFGSMSGGFGTVVPTTHDPTKLVKFATLLEHEAAAPKIFEKLDRFGRMSISDPHIGLPLKSHVFPGLDLPISASQNNTGAGSLVQILPKVPGKSLRDFVMADPKNLDILKAGITPESIANTVKRLEYLQKNNLGIDWQNPNNFMFDPVTGQFGIVDISAMPMSVITADGLPIRWFNSTGLNYGDIFEKAIGAVKGDPIRSSIKIRPVPHQILPMENANPNYSFLDEVQGYPRVWFRNPQSRGTWKSAFEQQGGLISNKTKKKQQGFQILTDANGKYVFVKT